MNERIKELEALAMEVEHSHGAFGEYEKYERLNVQKFAELIVLECAALFDPELHVEHEECIIRESILQYFGVDETKFGHLIVKVFDK